MIECVSQSLFYKLLFYYFRKNRVQTLFLLFYASKAIRLNLNLLLKILFWFRKYVSNWFKTFLWFLQNLWNWFGLIWIQYANSIKEIKKQKKKEKKEWRKKIKGLRESFGPVQRSSSQPSKKTEPVRSLSYPPSLTCGPHLPGHVVISFLRPKITPETVSPPVNSPSWFLLNTCRFVPESRL
jgi:hypothetical protein